MLLSVDGAEIPLLDTIKYLGIELEEKLTFRHHILKSCEMAIKYGRALFQLINLEATLNCKNKILRSYKIFLQILLHIHKCAYGLL